MLLFDLLVVVVVVGVGGVVWLPKGFLNLLCSEIPINQPVYIMSFNKIFLVDQVIKTFCDRQGFLSITKIKERKQQRVHSGKLT